MDISSTIARVRTILPSVPQTEEVEEHDNEEVELIGMAERRATLANLILEERDPIPPGYRRTAAVCLWRIRTDMAVTHAMRAIFQLTTTTSQTSPVASTTAASKGPALVHAVSVPRRERHGGTFSGNVRHYARHNQLRFISFLCRATSLTMTTLPIHQTHHNPDKLSWTRFLDTSGKHSSRTAFQLQFSLFLFNSYPSILTVSALSYLFASAPDDGCQEALSPFPAISILTNQLLL